MSLIFCDGFDDNLVNSGKWTYVTNISVVSGRNGNGAQLSGNSNGAMRKKVETTQEHATFIAGRAFFASSSSGLVAGGNQWKNLFTFASDDGVRPHIGVAVENGTIQVIRADGSTGFSTSAPILGNSGVNQLLTNQWYYIEAKVTLSDTVGAVEIRVNGIPWISLTNIDTKNGGTKSVFDTIAIQGSWGSGSETVVDDFYLCNGAGSVNNYFLGDIAVETLFPNGDGSISQWIGSDGNSVNNSLLVDELTPSTADYVESATTGNRDLYAVGNLTRTSGTIYGIISTAYAQKSDSGAMSLKNVIKSGATALASGAKDLATTYLPASSVFETDPSTSTAWTVSGINAAEIGVEVA